MSDDELIEAMARLWVDNGGNAEGIYWCARKIRAKVKEIMDKDRAEADKLEGK